MFLELHWSEDINNELRQMGSRRDFTSSSSHLPEGHGGTYVPECLVPFWEHYGHYRRSMGGQDLALPSRRPAFAAHQSSPGLGTLEDQVLGSGLMVGSGGNLSGRSVPALR